MSWVRIDDAAMTHPKIVALSDKAFRLWVWGLTYAQQHLTDGVLAVEAIPPRLSRAVPDLLERQLWEPHDRTFKVHDYLQWNDSKQTIQAKRQGAATRLSRWRNKRVSNASSETALARSGVALCGSGSEGGVGETADASLEHRAGRLREELYPAWYAKYRHGARLRLVANSLEYQDAMSLVTTWDDARLEKLARIVLTTDDEYISKTDRGFKIFALKASWADDRLRQAENGSR